MYCGPTEPRESNNKAVRPHVRPRFDEWDLREGVDHRGLKSLSDFLANRATSEEVVLLGVVGALVLVARSILYCGDRLTGFGLLGAIVICCMLAAIGFELIDVARKKYASNSKERTHEASHPRDASKGASAVGRSP